MQLYLQEDYNFVEVLWVLLDIVSCCQCECVCVIRNIYVFSRSVASSPENLFFFCFVKEVLSC